MPLAVTHVLTSIILVDIYRDYLAKDRDYFTLHTILIAGIGGLLPDIDMVFQFLSGLGGFDLPWLLLHGGITHTPFFAAIFLVPGLFLWGRGNRKAAMYFIVLFVGIMTHLALDFVLGGGMYEGVMWLFPFSLEAWKIHVLSYLQLSDVPAALDAVILVLWLWHEEAKHKIADFI